jgi:hypothetical protein
MLWHETKDGFPTAFPKTDRPGTTIDQGQKKRTPAIEGYKAAEQEPKGGQGVSGQEFRDGVSAQTKLPLIT